jgi:hypothetical protein
MLGVVIRRQKHVQHFQKPFFENNYVSQFNQGEEQTRLSSSQETGSMNNGIMNLDNSFVVAKTKSVCQQGCQMVCFQTNNPNLRKKTFRASDWKMLIYFMAILNILYIFGIFCYHLVHIVLIWYISSCFGIMHKKIWQPCLPG